MKSKMMVGLLILFAFAAFAVAGNSAAGKDVFSSNCVMCHGADASASTPMGKMLKIPDLHSPTVQKLSDADLTNVISKGHNRIPAFGSKLTAEQITQVVAFIRTLKK